MHILQSQIVQCPGYEHTSAEWPVVSDTQLKNQILAVGLEITSIKAGDPWFSKKSNFPPCAAHTEVAKAEFIFFFLKSCAS